LKWKRLDPDLDREIDLGRARARAREVDQSDAQWPSLRRHEYVGFNGFDDERRGGA